MGILDWLFGWKSSKKFVVRAFWCNTSIKLPRKVQTPLGGRVTILTVCVDIHYSVRQGDIALRRVRLSGGGGRILGSNSPINVAATRTGEAWYASCIRPDSLLIEAVQSDLAEKDSRLRKVMWAKWRDENRAGLVSSLVDALNAHASAEEIENLLSTAGRGNDIKFTYTKANGERTARHVCVHGVSGKSIRATDRKDELTKCFRIDRITNAQNAKSRFRIW